MIPEAWGPNRSECSVNSDVLQPGDTIDVRALHSDGVAYRWWEDRVESVGKAGIVSCSAVGNVVHGLGADWVSPFHARTHYWFDRPYVLAEIYDSAGQLVEIYVHIASPAVLEGRRLTYTDHELDVVLKPGHPPEVVDEDEFAYAAQQYGYTPEFQEMCYAAARDVLGFIRHWQPRGLPHRS